MTYVVYRYINRGLYEEHRPIFVFIVTMKILITSNLIQQSDMDIFLRGGAALDINSVQAKPFSWMSDSAWLNIVVLTQRIAMLAVDRAHYAPAAPYDDAPQAIGHGATISA